jgi:hypothetical protein
MPATRPRDSQSQEAEIPIMAPPMAADMGVNWVIAMIPRKPVEAYHLVAQS